MKSRVTIFIITITVLLFGCSHQINAKIIPFEDVPGKLTACKAVDENTMLMSFWVPAKQLLIGLYSLDTARVEILFAEDIDESCIQEYVFVSENTIRCVSSTKIISFDKIDKKWQLNSVEDIVDYPYYPPTYSPDGKYAAHVIKQQRDLHIVDNASQNTICVLSDLDISSTVWNAQSNKLLCTINDDSDLLVYDIHNNSKEIFRSTIDFDIPEPLLAIGNMLFLDGSDDIAVELIGEEHTEIAILNTADIRANPQRLYADNSSINILAYKNDILLCEKVSNKIDGMSQLVIYQCQDKSVRYLEAYERPQATIAYIISADMALVNKWAADTGNVLTFLELRE